MYKRSNHSLPKSQNGPEKKIVRSGRAFHGLRSLVSLITGEKMSQIRQEMRPWEAFPTFHSCQALVKITTSCHSCQALGKFTSFMPLLSGFWLRPILSELLSVRACVWKVVRLGQVRLKLGRRLGQVRPKLCPSSSKVVPKFYLS